jgi:hypothetical protein
MLGRCSEKSGGLPASRQVTSKLQDHTILLRHICSIIYSIYLIGFRSIGRKCGVHSEPTMCVQGLNFCRARLHALGRSTSFATIRPMSLSGSLSMMTNVSSCATLSLALGVIDAGVVVQLARR